MKFSEKITLIFLRALSRHLNRVTSTTRQRYVNWLAAFVYKCVPVRKKVAYSNIQRAFPYQNNEWVTKVLKGTYKMAIQNFIDFLSVPSSVSSTQFKIMNQEILDTAISRNRGTILVTGHFGLWEKWCAWLGDQQLSNYWYFSKTVQQGIRPVF